MAVAHATFTVKNTLPFAIKDPRFICANFGASGTELAGNTAIVYEILKAGQTRTFHDVDLGFIPQGAAKYNCFVGGATAL